MANYANMAALPARAIAYFFVTVIVLAGPVVLTIAAVAAIRQASFIGASTTADGTVLELRAVRGHRGAFNYAPLFRFTADDGRTYMLLSNTGTSPPGFVVGERVKVLYRSGDPMHAKIDSVAQLWLPEIILGAIGGVFSIFPVLILLRRRRLSP
jgi:hypothetical protein